MPATYIPGLESYLEYNGIYLHRRSGQTELYRVTAIDGLYGADVRDDRDANPGSHGETAFNAYYGGRTITIEGRIEALNVRRLREMTAALQAAFNDLTELPLTMHMNDSTADVYISCRINAPISLKEEQADTKPYRNFMISLRASDPRFYSATNTLYETTPNSTSYLARQYNRTYNLQYQLYIDANNNIVTTPSGTNINNLGNFESAPVYRIYGPCTNPIITNITTGVSMVTSMTLATSSDYIEIDIKNKSVTDNNGSNRFSIISPASNWVYLSPGPNDVRFIVGTFTTGSKLQVYYRSAFL